jgi:hypothetical protein
VNPSTLSDYTDQMLNLLGLVSQGTANYDYDKQGNLLPQVSIGRNPAYGEAIRKLKSTKVLDDSIDHRY